MKKRKIKRKKTVKVSPRKQSTTVLKSQKTASATKASELKKMETLMEQKHNDMT